MSEEFKHETRYLVVKLSKLDDGHASKTRLPRRSSGQEYAGKVLADCVVVESDWPEYESVWQMIERRVAGQPSELERVAAELDALQLHLNASHQRINELTASVPADPVMWGAPKTVRQLIHQLSTLDQDLEPLAMLRVPDYKDDKQVRAIPLSMSHERVEGQWLSDFKCDGRKVLAFWSKPDPRPAPEKLTYPAVSTWPEWANWIGLDATGYWVFYENKPETTEVGRIPQGGQWGGPRFAEPQRGWAEMLYERPTQLVRG